MTETEAAPDRAALFAAGPPRIPRRTIWITLAVAAVLGVGGAFADHSFNVQPTPSPTPVTHIATAQHETLAQFVGLKSLDDKAAPQIDLTDGSGRPFALSQLAGRPVMLTFLGPGCKETCPVVAPEIAKAEATLAEDRLRPAVVIVNADPQHLSVASARAALEHGPLAEIAGATFVTGSLAELQSIWKSYGVTIEDDPSTGALAYTAVVYLLDSAGRLRDSLTPFANESFSGTAALPTPEIDRFASAIATYVEQEREMTKRRPDPLAEAMYGDKAPSRRFTWQRWKRTALPGAVAIAIVIAAAVITDLPTHDSLAGQATAGAALLTEVNNDVAPCAFSLKEANTIYRDQLAGKVTASDRSRVPSLLQDDAAACSFTSDNVNDLADIEEPGTGAGRYLSEVISLAQTWTTSDALGAINDVISLEANPRDLAAARDLAARQTYLTSDRDAALAALTDADHYLHGTLPALQMPSIRLPKVPLS